MKTTRKICLILLATALLLSMTACGKSEAVKAVEEAITSIGSEITLSSGDVIEAAREAYDDLTPDEQKKVENLAALEDAEEELERLREEERKEKQAHLDDLTSQLDKAVQDEDEDLIISISDEILELAEELGDDEQIARTTEIREEYLAMMEDTVAVGSAIDTGDAREIMRLCTEIAGHARALGLTEKAESMEETRELTDAGIFNDAYVFRPDYYGKLYGTDEPNISSPDKDDWEFYYNYDSSTAMRRAFSEYTNYVSKFYQKGSEKSDEIRFTVENGKSMRVYYMAASGYYALIVKFI